MDLGRNYFDNRTIAWELNLFLWWTLLDWFFYLILSFFLSFLVDHQCFFLWILLIQYQQVFLWRVWDLREDLLSAFPISSCITANYSIIIHGIFSDLDRLTCHRTFSLIIIFTIPTPYIALTDRTIPMDTAFGGHFSFASLAWRGCQLFPFSAGSAYINTAGMIHRWLWCRQLLFFSRCGSLINGLRGLLLNEQGLITDALSHYNILLIFLMRVEEAR